MRTHDLKTWPAEFSAVLSGEKRAEVRRDDRCFHVNDLLILREWSPEGGFYSGRTCTVRITHIVRGWGLPEDLAVLSIRLEGPRLGGGS